MKKIRAGRIVISGLTPSLRTRQAQIALFASAYSRSRRATSSATGCTDLTAPMPCPLPQMSRHALASDEELLAEAKLIAFASRSGRLSGSRPDLTIDGFR